MIKINVKKPTVQDSILADSQVASVWLRLQRAMLYFGDGGLSPLVAAEDLAWSIRIKTHVNEMRTGKCNIEDCPGCEIAKGNGKVEL